MSACDEQPRTENAPDDTGEDAGQHRAGEASVLRGAPSAAPDPRWRFDVDAFGSTFTLSFCPFSLGWRRDTGDLTKLERKFPGYNAGNIGDNVVHRDDEASFVPVDHPINEMFNYQLEKQGQPRLGRADDDEDPPGYYTLPRADVERVVSFVRTKLVELERRRETEKGK